MKKWLSILVMALVLASFGAAQVPPITHTATLSVAVATSPDFTLELSTTSITTYPNRTIGFAAALKAVNTFAGNVTVTLTGVPAGWIVTPTPVNGTVTVGGTDPVGVDFSIVIPAGAAVGTSTITVTATSSNYN